MQLAWGARVSAEFRAKVVQIAAGIGCDPSDLMACMAFETGRTFMPAARNTASGATGLIQFMPSTALNLGTTVEDLARMSAEDQLAYVNAYFLPYRGALRSLSDVYMAILWPAAIGKAEDAVIFAAGSRAYLGNRGLDLNHDNAVTKAEAASFVVAAREEGMRAGNVFDMTGVQPAAPIEDHSTQAPTEGAMGVAIPLLLQLVPQILQLFSARAQTQISKATGADPALAAQFMQDLIAKVGTATNIPVTDNASAVQAVAAVTSMPPPQQAPAVAQIEEQALDYLDKLAPLLDKIAAQEKALWAARDASADAAGTRGRLDRVDIAPALVRNGTVDFRGALIGIIALLAIQMYFDENHKPDPTLSGFLGLFAYGVIRLMDRPSAYRFGGAFENSTAIDTSRAMVDQTLAERRKATT